MNGTTTIRPFVQLYYTVNTKSVIEVSGGRWLVNDVGGLLAKFLQPSVHYKNKNFNEIHLNVGRYPVLVYVYCRCAALKHFSVSIP